MNTDAPAVVANPSTLILSFISMGIPYNKLSFSLLLSSSLASLITLGLSDIIAFKYKFLSNSWIYIL